MSTEKLEQSVIIIEEGLGFLRGVIAELVSAKANLTLVLEENVNLKDDNNCLADERDSQADVLDKIKKALEDT